ncbi:MAG: hypothetical protein V9G19_07140 [Tetrasphaera sp.]
MRGRLATVLAVLAALFILAAPRGDAALPAPTVPEEVADVFAKDVLAWVVADPDGKDADQIGKITGVDTVHEAFGFTTDFLRGDAAADPIRSLKHWSGVLRAGRAGVGVASVEEQDGAISPARFTMSADLAAALEATGSGYYVEGPAGLGHWMLAGQTLTPLDAEARRIAVEPLALTAAQPLLHERWASSAPRPGLARAGLLVLGALVLIGIGLVLIARGNAAARRGPGSPPAARLVG